MPESYGLNPEPINGDTLTKYLRSITNTLGSQGEQTFGTGQGVFGQGIKDFGPSMNYFNEILSGNKAQMESAVAPEKADILSQYRARRRNIAQQGARGGGTNEAVAASEFGEAGDVAKLLQRLRPEAAKESSDIAGKISQLGLSESQLGSEQMFAALSGLLQRRGQNIQEEALNYGLAENLISALI